MLQHIASYQKPYGQSGLYEAHCLQESPRTRIITYNKITYAIAVPYVDYVITTTNRFFRKMYIGFYHSSFEQGAWDFYPAHLPNIWTGGDVCMGDLVREWLNTRTTMENCEQNIGVFWNSQFNDEVTSGPYSTGGLLLPEWAEKTKVKKSFITHKGRAFWKKEGIRRDVRTFAQQVMMM